MLPTYLEPIRQSYFLWSNKKLVLSSLTVILLSSLSFGLWFKVKQVSIASDKIIGLYPLTGYAVSSLKTLFIFSILWLVLTLFNSLIRNDLGRADLARNIFLCSLPFSVFFLSWVNISISMQVFLFSFVCGTLLFFNFQKTSFWTVIKKPVYVLIFYLLCFFLILESYSPLYHNTFWDTWGRNDYLINLEQQWENAKAYDFIANFTQSGALGGHPQGIYIISELSSFIILIFDLPIIDLLGKFASVKFLYLGFYIFGTFGTYLFFRYGLKLPALISTIGGLGFFWGNASYLAHMTGEFPFSLVPFTFFPWVMLFIKLAYSFNRPILSCLAGLVASLSEYAMSSHPEADVVNFIFCNIYNLYLASIRITKSGFQSNSVKRFFGWLVIFPAFWGIGLSYRIIPMLGAILNKEYAIFDRGDCLGFCWSAGVDSFKIISTLLFRFEDVAKTSGHSMAQSDLGVGAPVYLFIGQPLLFFAFAFVCLTFITLYKKALNKPNQYLQHAYLNSSFFFLLTYLILSWNLPNGSLSWLSELLSWTGFIRIHNGYRVTTYYFFFALVVGMYGLNFLLRIKKIFTLNILFITFITMLGVAYISPLHLAQPDKILLDGMLLLLGYLLVRSYILTYQNKNFPGLQFLVSIKTLQLNRLFTPLMNVSNLRNTVSVLIIGVTFFSFVNLSVFKRNLLTQNNPGLKKSNTYVPARVSVTQLKNNQHDMASFAFLENEIERFAFDFSNKRKKSLRRNVSAYDTYSHHYKVENGTTIVSSECFNELADKKYDRIYKKLSKHMDLGPNLQRKITKINKSTNKCRESYSRPLTMMLAKNENLKTLKTENGFLDSRKLKNIYYLIKRSLNIFSDPIWRYTSILTSKSNSIFVQRRFHQNLKNVETVDLVFSSKILKKLIDYTPLPETPSFLHINLRLAGTALPGNEYILPINYLPTEIIKNKKNEITLRIHIGQMIRMENTVPLKKDSNYFYFFNLPKIHSNGNIFLKEMIFSTQDHQNSFFDKVPLKRIDFKGFKSTLPKTDPPMNLDFLIQRITNSLESFRDLMTTAKPSWKPSWKSSEKKLEFFNEIAPERDNFYFLDEPSTNILIDSFVFNHGALTYNINNIPQFYFPDEYQLFLFLNLMGTKSMPVGKKSEITAGMWFGEGPGYPSIDVAFHLGSLFYKTKSVMDKIAGFIYDLDNPSIDWPHYGVDIDQILENPRAKKILNILGIDFLVFPKTYFNHVHALKVGNPAHTLGKTKLLIDKGLIPFDLPKSYKFTPRFFDFYGTQVLKNPESYGKAYIAKWVKTIKPNENDFNRSIFELGMSWPKSRELIEHFNQHLSEIPDSQGATLIESKDHEDFKINPHEYQSNSKVEIVKIIASKAVFDVDCKEEHCWLVYNTAALNGWKAFSGSERLQIHKANLGFIGVKLDRGQHFVWMEYQPWLPAIGLFIALSGWIFTFAKITFYRHSSKGLVEEYS